MDLTSFLKAAAQFMEPAQFKAFRSTFAAADMLDTLDGNDAEAKKPVRKKYERESAAAAPAAAPAAEPSEPAAEEAAEEEFDFGKAVEMSIADAAAKEAAEEPADEAAEETADEVAEMAALAEEEESPSMSDDYAGMPEDGSSVESKQAAEEPADMPKAEAVYTPEQAQELFKVTHGSDFDPKSSLDKRKMKEIEETLVEQGGLGDKSPNRFALDIYRKYKYV